MHFKRHGSLLRGDDSGAVAVIVAFLMFVLIGTTALVVDVGALYQERREMVNFADAVALAGAQELYLTRSENAAELYAERFAREHYDFESTTTAGPTVTVEADLDSQSFTVETEGTVELTFAAVIGFSRASVPARAVAMYAPLGRVSNLRPIGISESLWLQARENPQTDLVFQEAHNEGTWGFIYFDGDDGRDATVTIRMRDGDGVAAVGEDVYIIQGIPAGGSDEAKMKSFDYLAQLIETGEVVYLPITADREGTGQSDPVEVLGFAAVRFTYSTGPQGAHTAVGGVLLSDSFAPGFIMPGGRDTGLWGVGLVE